MAAKKDGVQKTLAYNIAMRRRVESNVDKRTSFVMQTEALFGQALILWGKELAQRPALEVVRSQCVGRYWELSANGDMNTLWHKAMPRREPPKEIHALATVEHILQNALVFAHRWNASLSNSAGTTFFSK